MIGRSGDLKPLNAWTTASGISYRGFTRIGADQESQTLPLIFTDYTDQEIAELAEVRLSFLFCFFIRDHPRKSAVKDFLISVISANQW